MRNLSICLLLFLLSTSVATAQLWKQQPFEVGGGITTSSYFGDLGGYPDGENLFGLKDISFSSPRATISIFGLHLFGTYQFHEQMKAKVSYTSGYITGSDLNGINAYRGYEFEAIINEFSALYQYYIIKDVDTYLTLRKRGSIENPFSLYVEAGFGGVFYESTPNPELENRIENDTYMKSPQPTAGIIFPVGIGFKMRLFYTVSLGAEFTHKFTRTDYIDSFSSTGSSSFDMYQNLNIFVSYKF